MKSNDVLRVFKISATKLISHKDTNKWKEVLKDFRYFDDKEVEKELNSVVSICGSDRPLFYYLSAVRRRLIDKQHTKNKSFNMPKCIKDLFR
jgi:hypothetical protein